MKRPLVIGYGNTLREDDGVGVRAAQLLREALADADVMQSNQLTPELAERIAAASLVIFLDAAVDQPCGSVRSREIGAENADSWSHHLSPGQLLGIARQLAGFAPPAFLVSGGVDRMGWSEGLSTDGAETAAAMAAAAIGILSADSGELVAREHVHDARGSERGS